MFEIRGKMISAKQRLFQVLKISSVMIDDNCDDHDDSITSMSKYVPYKQVEQARLEAELKISEAYAWYGRRKGRRI